MGGLNIETAAEKIALELLAEQEEKSPDERLELVDTEYVKERGDWYLRVYIDKPSGVGLSDCQEFSRKLEEILDKDDIFTGAYVLEVSSPGLDRVLKKDRDFVRERGKKVDVSLYAPLNGVKKLTGVLIGRDEANLILENDVVITRDKVAQVRLHIDF